ncbi:hypothetical protein ACFUTR_16900 [Streptomyces sp. NPDC057367]|uniref:hypothetical protein n=1 Tax=Streptomyces sp. NPDC057367 TaxID=3346108 RepID=UPI00362E4442
MPNRTTRNGERHRPTLATLLATLTATLSLTACGSSHPADDSPASPASPATPQPRTEAPGPSISAADGADIGACADGNCEVAVTRPATVRFQAPGGTVALSIAEVGQEKIEYEVKSGNGQTKGGTTGAGQGCVTALRENGSGTSCGGMSGTRPSARPGAVVIQASTGPDGTALLHVVTP